MTTPLHHHLHHHLPSSSHIHSKKKEIYKDDKISINEEEIKQAPGFLTTSDEIFDVFKKVTSFLSYRECFQSIAFVSKTVREAVLQNHFFGNSKVVYNYLIEWMKSMTKQDHLRKELPPLIERYNISLNVHGNTILLILSCQFGCEGILSEILKGSKKFELWSTMSQKDVGELMIFSNLKFYSINYDCDLFSILLGESLTNGFLNEARILYDDFFMNPEYYNLSDKEKVLLLDNIMNIALERDLPNVYFWVLDKILEQKQSHVHELAEEYNRLSQQFSFLANATGGIEDDTVPIMEDEEIEMEETVREKIIEKYIHSRFKQLILNCPNIFFDGLMNVMKETQKPSTMKPFSSADQLSSFEGEEKELTSQQQQSSFQLPVSTTAPASASYVTPVRSSFEEESNNPYSHNCERFLSAKTRQEKEQLLLKFIFSLVQNNDKDLTFVLERICSYLDFFSMDFCIELFQKSKVFDAVVRSSHFGHLLSNIIDREKQSVVKDVDTAFTDRILTLEQLKKSFEALEKRMKFNTAQLLRDKLMSYRESDLL
ncbi:hypothetical protein ABK040_002446 [Willaertia magna]